MKKMKRWTSLSLALLMIASIIPYSGKEVFARNNDSAVPGTHTEGKDPNSGAGAESNGAGKAGEGNVNSGSTEKDEEAKKDELEKAKTEAEDKIGKMENLSQEEKNGFKTKIKNAESIDNINLILTNALNTAIKNKEKEEEKKKDELDRLKNEAKNKIAGLKNLTDTYKKKAVISIEKAADENEIKNILKDASEVDKTIEEAKKKAEEDAKKKAEEDAKKKAEEDAKKKTEEEKTKKELKEKIYDAKKEIDKLKNLSSSSKRRYRDKLDDAKDKNQVERILSDAKKENRKDDSIEIKAIDVYKDAVVVKVNEKDVKVKISHKKNSTESAKATKKVSDKEYLAIVEVKYYEKADREKAKVIAEKSSFKDSKEYDLDSSKVKTHNEYYLEKNLTKVNPKNTDLKNSKTKVEGKLEDYKNTKIYVYFEGYEIGSGKTDSKGEFEIKIYDVLGSSREKDLKFYVKENKKEESKRVYIIKAEAGTKTVEGKEAGKEAEVTVKDSKGNIIGKTTADRDGRFTVNLYRELEAQEKITVTAKEKDKSESKTDYIVPGMPKTKGGYINGYSDGHFRPDGRMTRSEAAAMIARLKNGSSDFNTGTVTKFTDANNSWYSKALNYAVREGIIDGYEDGTFRPDNSVTRAEFTKMIAKELKGNSVSLPFTDTVNHWAKNEIAKAYGNNVIKGYEDGTFRPDSSITRAEAVKMLNKVFNIKTANYTKHFSDVNQNQWFYTDIMNAAN